MVTFTRFAYMRLSYSFSLLLPNHLYKIRWDRLQIVFCIQSQTVHNSDFKCHLFQSATHFVDCFIFKIFFSQFSIWILCIVLLQFDFLTRTSIEKRNYNWYGYGSGESRFIYNFQYCPVNTLFWLICEHKRKNYIFI